jgi:hypothetical protein
MIFAAAYYTAIAVCCTKMSMVGSSTTRQRTSRGFLPNLRFCQFADFAGGLQSLAPVVACRTQAMTGRATGAKSA